MAAQAEIYRAIQQKGYSGVTLKQLAESFQCKPFSLMSGLNALIKKGAVGRGGELYYLAGRYT